ncbi:hypothetical protein AVEN_45034-1, partial [Araneus ventricosus]
MTEHVMQTEQDSNANVKNLGKEKHAKKVTPVQLILARIKEHVKQTEQDSNVNVKDLGKEKHAKI